MRTTVKISVLSTLLMLFFTVSTVFGLLQPIPPWRDWRHGCEPWGIELFEPISDVFDYGSACEVYLECNADEQATLGCELTAAHELLQSCPPDDLDCMRQALLFTNLLGAIHRDGFVFGEQIPREAVLERLRGGTQAFVDGKFTLAQAYFNVSSDLYYNAAFPFARALIYEQIGDHEAALASYEEVLNIRPADGLVRYTRAHLFARLGQETRAAFEAYWLHEFTADDPQLSEIVAPLVEAYPLDMEQFETWIAYPMLQQGSGTAGTFYTDLTDHEGVPVRIRFDEAADGAFALDLLLATTPQRDIYFGVHAVDAYFLRELAGTFLFSVSISPSPEGGTHYAIELAAPEGADDPDLYIGETSAHLFESSGRQQFVLVPEGSDDPRLALREDVCGVVSRISKGMQVIDADYYSIPEFYEQPNTQNLIDIGEGHYDGPLFTITGESQCIEGDSGPVRWWPVVTEDGIEGWIPENEGPEYLFNPVDEPGPGDDAQQWLTIE